MSAVAPYRGRSLAALLAALAACARPSDTKPPPQPEPPRQPEPPPPTEVTEQPAEPPAEPPATDEPAREDRHGAVTTIAPPVPSQDKYVIWGGITGSALGKDYGVAGFSCPRGVEPPPPSYVRGGRRSLARLRSAVVVDGSAGVAQRLLAGRAATLRSCHLEAMETDPTAAGDLRLRLDIGANGGVLAVAVEASELPAIDECVRQTAQYWRFPKDEPATLTATFELRTEPAPPKRPAKPRCRR